MPSPEVKAGLVQKGRVREISVEIDSRGIELFLLTGRRFDLPTKKEIASLCEEIGEEIISSVLRQKELEALSVYPVDKKGRFLSREKAAAELGMSPSSGSYLARKVRWALRKVSWRLIIGENAIETLRLRDGFYLHATRDMGIRRIGQIKTLSEEKIRKLCGRPSEFESLKKAIKARGIDWEPPEVEFSNLPSGPGYSRTSKGKIYRG